MKRHLALVLLLLLFSGSAFAQRVAPGVDPMKKVAATRDGEAVTSANPLPALSERKVLLSEFDNVEPWAAFNTDTTTVARTADHVSGFAAISFAKVNGAANTTFGMIAQTFTIAQDMSGLGLQDTLSWGLYVPDLTDVNYAVLRLGTNATNYNEWRVADTELTAAAWQTISVTLDSTEATVTGAGWDPSAVTYAAIGLVFDLETDALAGIRVDALAGLSSPGVRTVDTGTGGGTDVNLIQVGGAAVALGPAAPAASLPVTQDTTGLWTSDLEQVGGAAFALGAAAPAAALPVVQDTTGLWTFDLDQVGGAPYGLGAAIPGLSLSVTQDTVGLWTVDTELAAAGALGDGMANPTVPTVGSAGLIWDAGGGVWSRMLGTAGRVSIDLDLVNGSQLQLGSTTPANSLPVAQSQPNGTSVNSALIVGNQANGISIAANANRANLLIQSSGTTTCLVAIGAATGGTNGVIIAGGTADDDGTGAPLTTESTEAVYIYDLSGAGTCKYRYIEEVW